MDRLAQAFEHEWRLARAARRAGDLDRAFHHLERAHILGQRHTGRHVGKMARPEGGFGSRES